MSDSYLSLTDNFGATIHYPKDITVTKYALWKCYWEQATDFSKKQIRDPIGEYTTQDELRDAIQETQLEDGQFYWVIAYLSDGRFLDLDVKTFI